MEALPTVRELQLQSELFLQLEEIFREEASLRKIDLDHLPEEDELRVKSVSEHSTFFQRLYRRGGLLLTWGIIPSSPSWDSKLNPSFNSFAVHIALKKDDVRDATKNAEPLFNIATNDLLFQSEPYCLFGSLSVKAMEVMQVAHWNGRPYRRLFRWLLSEFLWKDRPVV